MSAKILIIDDSMSVRASVRVPLESSGLVTVEAHDGLEGIQKIKADEAIELVVCDVNMPRLDGFGVLRFMAKHRPNLPMVMLTTNTQPATVQKARAMGAQTWIIKPIDPDRLVSTIQYLLSEGCKKAA